MYLYSNLSSELRDSLASSLPMLPRTTMTSGQLVLIGRSAHLTLEVICLLGMEDLGCVPNIAADAFQPVQVIFIYILQQRRKTKGGRYSEFTVGPFDGFLLLLDLQPAESYFLAERCLRGELLKSESSAEPIKYSAQMPYGAGGPSHEE